MEWLGIGRTGCHEMNLCTKLFLACEALLSMPKVGVTCGLNEVDLAFPAGTPDISRSDGCVQCRAVRRFARSGSCV